MKRFVILVAGCALALTACNGNRTVPDPSDKREPDAKYVGQAVANFSAEEWYPGGMLGTTDNVTEGCYEDETPAVTAQGLERAFNLGEAAFERKFTIGRSPAHYKIIATDFVYSIMPCNVI